MVSSYQQDPLPESDAASAQLWLEFVPPGGPVRPADLAVLSSAETARLTALRQLDDRRLYAAAHALARRVLARCLGRDPVRVPIRSKACPGCGDLHGRPMVDGEPGLGISLSHTAGAVLVGLSLGPIGVDIERVPALKVVADVVAELHPAERALFETVPVAKHPAAFAQLWVRKEAYLKAIGTGLDRSPSLDYLGPDSTLRPQGWALRDIECGPSHRAAVVVQQSGPAGGSCKARIRLVSESSPLSLIADEFFPNVR